MFEKSLEWNGSIAVVTSENEHVQHEEMNSFKAEILLSRPCTYCDNLCFLIIM